MAGIKTFGAAKWEKIALAAWVLWLVIDFEQLPWRGGVPAALIACAALAGLGSYLPLQNIVMIGLGLFVGEALLELGLDKAGAGSCGAPALFWVGVTVYGRRMARWSMRRRRDNKLHGIWLILFAAAFSSLVQLTMDPRNPNLAAIRFAAACFFLFALFPWFIQKRPAPQL